MTGRAEGTLGRTLGVEGLTEGVVGLDVEGNLSEGLVEGLVAGRFIPLLLIGLLGLTEGLVVGLFTVGLFTFPGRIAGETGFL